MQRRSFIHKTGLAGVLAAGAAPAIVHAQANIRWRIASSFPRSLDTIFGGAEVFAKKIGEMSGGKFKISVHAPTIDYRAAAESDVEPITIVDGEQSVDLAPGETQKLELKITGNRRGTFALQATVDCGEGCKLYEAGAFEAVDIDGKRTVASKQ